LAPLCNTKHTDRIHQLSIVVNAEYSDRALLLRRQLNNHWESLLPELERAFDALTPTGKWLHIPKLQLKISVGDTKDLERYLPKLLRHAIMEQLPQDIDTQEVIQQGEDPQQEPNKPTHLKTTINNIDLLRDYLKTGRLPWYAKSDVDWQPLFYDLITGKLPQLLLTAIQSGDSYQSFRLLALMQANDLKRIPDIISTIATNASEQTQKYSTPIINALINDELKTTGPHQKLWILSCLLTHHMLGSNTRSSHPLKSIPMAQRLTEPQLNQWLNAREWSTEQRIYLQQTIFSQITNITAQTETDNSVSGHIISTAKQQPEQQERVQQSDEDSCDNQEHVIAQQIYFAGAILLHPYIPHYFQACGIDKTISAQQREKAAAILAYAITGEEKIVEYQLDLIKLLIGLPLTYPLPLAAGLVNDDDKAEAENMLMSFISHWRAIKNTSTSGLRQTFLQRPGLLKKQDQGWLLKIERSGVDVLLDQLPFGYSVVKLPWMQQPIHVEW